MSDLDIAPAFAIAHVDPSFFDNLTGIERLVLAFDLELWLRPDQRIPRYQWRSYGLKGGRGFGKSLAISYEFNCRVERGLVRAPALMAPNEARVHEVQVDFLVATSPPWFRAEPYDGGVRWPNGVTATAYTPEAPGRSRSGNHDLTWMCEIVDWQPSTRLEAYQNLATATRVGDAQIIWDSTSKGKNEVIQHLLKENKRDPRTNPIVEGTTFDNPLLSKQYLQAVVAQYVKDSRAYQEEIEGKTFTESAGALWCQAWLDDGRRIRKPDDLEIVIVALDPSLSAGPEADEFGSCVIGRDPMKHLHVLEDLSGRQAPEQAVAAAIERCKRDAAGIIYERNHAGDMPLGLARVICRDQGLRVEVLDDPERPFPGRRPGVVYVRSITASESKGSRAEAPAALYQQGRVHHVGTFDLLELEQTTWEPGRGKSPNRLDACVHGIAELAELRVPDQLTDGDECTRAQAAQKLLRSALLGHGGGGRRFGL